MLVDAHNHMDFYGDNLNTALDMIRENEIATLACSTDEESYLFAEKLSEDNPRIIPCFGIHPWKAHENCHELERFDAYIRRADVIGEIGLDYHWVRESAKYPCMRKVFTYFVEKAREYDKLTNMHTKGAEGEVLELIKKHSLRMPIIHWYSGDLEKFREYLDYGCYFTIGADAGYSELTRRITEALPLDRILTETDGPTALEWVCGQYGYPIEVRNVLLYIALIKGLPFEQVRDAVADNFRRLTDGFFKNPRRL